MWLMLIVKLLPFLNELFLCKVHCWCDYMTLIVIICFWIQWNECPYVIDKPVFTLQAEILDEDKRLVASMDYYFIEMDGTRFKVSLSFQPYFLILARRECEQEVIQYLSKKFAGTLYKIDVIKKEDLELVGSILFRLHVFT